MKAACYRRRFSRACSRCRPPRVFVQQYRQRVQTTRNDLNFTIYNALVGVSLSLASPLDLTHSPRLLPTSDSPSPSPSLIRPLCVIFDDDEYITAAAVAASAAAGGGRTWNGCSIQWPLAPLSHFSPSLLSSVPPSFFPSFFVSGAGAAPAEGRKEVSR